MDNTLPFKIEIDKLHDLVSSYINDKNNDLKDTDKVINFISEQSNFTSRARCHTAAKFAVISLGAALLAEKHKGDSSTGILDLLAELSK